MFLSLTVFVSPTFAQSTNALPPLAPAYGEIPATFWELHGTAMLVAGFVFLAVVGAASWMILRARPPVIPPPEVLARETLTKLLRQSENGKVLSEISQTLRRYLAAAFNLPPVELTTAEFSRALGGSQSIGPELAQAIAGFLRECDQRKFSPANAGSPLNAASQALKLVEQSELRLKQSMNTAQESQ
jgi:hypothetical protein